MPRGEIPNELKISPKNKFKINDNGLKVVSEVYNGGIATVSVYLKAGSRFEPQTMSGVSYLAQKMLLFGNNNVDQSQVKKFLEQNGTNIEVTIDREKIGFTVSVLKDNLDKALNLFSKLFTNPVFSEAQFEVQKENLAREAARVSEDQMEATIDSAHNVCFRDHQMGQPLKGNKDTIRDLQLSDVKEFLSSRLYQSNMVVVATGDLNCEDFEAKALSAFEKVEKYEQPVLEKYTIETPLFTSSLTLMRDDEMPYFNGGVFFKGPGYGHEDMTALNFITSILGEYRADIGINMHLNSSDRQYHSAHKFLADCPDLLIHKCMILPYSDVSMIGGYGYGNEVYASKIMYYTQYILSFYGKYINQADVFRTRAELFNKLLTKQTGLELNEEIANEALYLSRRIDRTEMAYRYSHLSDTEHLQRIANKWFYGKDVAAIGWGSCHGIIANGVFSRNLFRSTLGRSGAYPFLAS